MNRLISMAMRIVMWGAFGAGLAYILVFAKGFLFTGGATFGTLNFGDSAAAAAVGAVIGGVVGFFRRT